MGFDDEGCLPPNLPACPMKGDVGPRFMAEKSTWGLGGCMISLSLYHHSPTWRIIFGAYVLSYLEDGPPISHGEAGEENNPRSWGLTITMGLLTTWDDPFKYRTPPQNVPNLSFRGKAGLMKGKGLHQPFIKPQRNSTMFLDPTFLVCEIS